MTNKQLKEFLKDITDNKKILIYNGKYKAIEYIDNNNYTVIIKKGD